ncbi:hypothetical protein [Apilactobacillus xinyiensis]|uniref:hypothetical protein n=1 Tax=Apilactobacillus xinyiensis TaxID=2841032 RepID=UPI00200DACFC|nr:hypothetical protein [Apilactobacillus xinyiensis]MCL0318595.1 hypothetical protein [Apilactobacillus xinyiensis]
MKLRRMFIGLILTFSFAIFASNVSANASTWHKGVPSFLKNTSWRSHHECAPHEKSEIAADNKKIVAIDSVNPYVLSNKHTYYKHISKDGYLLHGIPGAQGITGGKISFEIKRSGKNKIFLYINKMIDPITHKNSKEETKTYHGPYYRVTKSRLLSAF